MIISEFMSRANLAAAPDTCLRAVIDDMYHNWRSCTLVGDSGHVVGIITERDIVRVCGELFEQHQEGKLPDLQARDVMTPTPKCLHENTPLYDALVFSRSQRLRHIPVVNDQDTLVGLVTQTDMVNAYVTLMERQEQLEASNRELHNLAMEDALMSIGNRHAMEVDLKYTQAAAKRDDKTYAIAMLDVDWFKKYNDHYGHQSGDKVLIAVSNAVKGAVRESDRVYRYGGEEILVLMPDTDTVGAIQGAERMRKAISDLNIEHEKSPLRHITVSVGVSAEKAGEWKALVKRADEALYRAKDAGRDSTEFA